MAERIERLEPAAPGYPVLAAARAQRVAVLASADVALRRGIAETLLGMRWEVQEASGGAELFERLESGTPGTILLDSWLPDLDVGECVRELSVLYPRIDVLALDGTDLGILPPQGPFRNEVLHALRRSHPSDDVPWSQAPPASAILRQDRQQDRQQDRKEDRQPPGASGARATGSLGSSAAKSVPVPLRSATAVRIPEILGEDARMLEVSRRIRLVAPRGTAVLVQGPTGSGKELVARALHRLSRRAGRPFLALNCAAIPEALLEAELFGHTRGAFTGAVQGRTGRLEAAHGGTLFLDEIGELPLALQAKLLRFVECGELQRVGENEPVRVDVRIIAATHRHLQTMAAAGTFRADLYYRLSVFLIETPALAGRPGDIRLLAEHALARMGRTEPAKELTPGAWERLIAHRWPGNVRELEHTLERAWILAEERPMIAADEIEFGPEVEP